MYHISKDKRSQASAQLIWEGLLDCLAERPFKMIKIIDIHNKSYISRATFYRLFDTTTDVLAYRCDLVFETIIAHLNQHKGTSTQELLLTFIGYWLEEQELLTVLIQNDLIHLIIDCHTKNFELIHHIFLNNTELSDKEKDYLSTILTFLIPAVMTAWSKQEEKDKPEQVLELLRQSLSLISDYFIRKPN